MLDFLSFIVISQSVILSIATKQNPFRDPNICGSPICDDTNKKFGFSNSIYRYEYSIDLNSAFYDTDDNASSIFLRASVEFFFPKHCEGLLRIEDVKIWDTELQQKSTEFNNGEYDKNFNWNEEDYYGEFSDIGRDELTHENFNKMHPKNMELANDLKKYLLRFSFHDGLISEICPTSTESIWTLNFKRGILSAFQNTMLRFDVDHNTTEIDISGECNVQYMLENTNDVFIKIRKTKHISTCRNRYSTHSILQSTPYNSYHQKTLWHLLESKSHCDMIVNNNIYQEITCYEYHTLTALSNNNSGAMTKVTSRLVMQDESHSSAKQRDNYYDLVSKRVSLIFDHTPYHKRTNSEIKLARDLLKDICSLGFPSIQREFIGVFTNFISTIRQLDYKALTQLLTRSISICERGKYHVLDSLPYIGSSASFQLMRDQLLTNSISKKMALNWLKSMSFIQRPDEDIVETFYTILEFTRSKTEPEYTLSASAVIHSYCRHISDCSQNIRVKSITASLEAEFINIFNSYNGERRSYERMIVIIKSLGNIGILSEKFIDQMRNIIVNELAAISIRLEAVFAFRRTDCIQHRSIFVSVYTNYTINSEVRIASYLQAMICPNYYIIKNIKNVLKTEEINQVGSFVWSHLSNLAKSSSPLNIEVQSLLLDNDLSDKYDMDIRKFSRNFEQTFFFDEYNFGITTDTNLIFGTESYIPRMVKLNLTTNIFGHSINFLELSTRAVGFEHLFTSFFNTDQFQNGDNYFKKKGLNKVLAFFSNWLSGKDASYNDLTKNFTDDSSYLHMIKRKLSQNHTQSNVQFGYSKCNQKCLSKMKDLSEHRKISQNIIENFGYKMNYDYNSPKLQLALRIFGNDLHFFNLNGIPEILEFIKKIDALQNFFKILSGKEVVYTKSNVFCEASYVVPLSVGLPLSIDIFGASVLDLRLSGKFEQFANFYPGWNFDIKGMIKPTILIDVVGRMRSDLFYIQSGIKVKSSLYSNSEVESILKVRGKQLISFSFSLPQNKSEILSLRSEILKMSGNEDKPHNGVGSRRANSTCTWPLLDTAIGLKVCVDYSVPNVNHSKEVIYPALLLSGPLSFSIILAKSDQTAKNWTFEYTSIQEHKNTTLTVLLFTPGSSFKRLIVANISTIPDSLNASILFIHGNNKASVIGQYIGNNNHRILNILLDTNGNRSLDLNIELDRHQIRNIWIYKPKMFLAVNGIKVTGVVGTVRINEKNGISQSDVDFSFETRKLQMLIRGIIVQSEISKSANITFNYRFQANKIESITVEGRVVNTGDKVKIEYHGKVKLKASAHPRLNFVSNMTWRSLQGHTEGVWAYNRLQDFENPNTTSIIHLLLVRSYSGENVWDGSRWQASFTILIPRSSINTKILLKHEERYKNGTEHNIIVGLRLTPDREAILLFSLMLPHQNLLSFDGFFNMSITRFNSCFGHLKITEQLPKTYLVNFNGTWFTEQSVAIKAKYKARNHRIQVLKMTVESASFETISFYTSYSHNETFSLGHFHLKNGDDPYRLTLQTSFKSDPIKRKTFEMRIQIKEKKYWLNTSMLMEQPLTLQVEVHLDKLRDIYVRSIAMYFEEKKELSVELNWDMNRDPSQRLLLLIEYLRLNNKDTGKILVTYPDRTISCSFNTNTQGPKYHGEAHVSWEMNELVVVKYDIEVAHGESINQCIHLEIHTPFRGWRRNTLDAAVYNKGPVYFANMSLVWGEKQKFGLICKYDINIDRVPFSFDVRFVLNSSLIEMPSVTLEIFHKKDDDKFVTDINLLYNNANEIMKVYGLNSIWELNKSQHCQNVRGTVFITSPHEKLRRGSLVTKFSLKDRVKIQGAATLTLNLREITLSMDGYVNKVNDNMILINITTPLNRLRNINGRFGFIEKKRHFVADIQTSSTTLGVEALFDITSLTDFDVRFSVGIPFINLKHTAIFSKLRRDAIDMRAKWNNTIIGFIGVWYMNDLKDFEYSCKVFTPLKDFEENGYTVKLFKKDSLVLNLHCKLLRYSLGVNIKSKKNFISLQQFWEQVIELEAKYDDYFKLPIPDYNELHLIQYQDFFSYNIELQLDLLIWPSIEGILDIDQILDYYFAVIDIKHPQGYISIKNSLYYPDYFNIVNILNLQTPFALIKELKLVFEHRVDVNLHNFYEKLYYIFNNASKASTTSFKKAGCELSYRKISHSILPSAHQLTIRLALPSGEDVDIIAKMHLDENIFSGSLKVNAWTTLLELVAALEAEENFFEGSTDILLAENSITQYKCRAYFKQDLSKKNNSLCIIFDINNRNQISKFQAQSVWQIDTQDGKITSEGNITTTILPIKTFEYAFLLIKRKNVQLNLDLRLLTQNSIRMDYGLRTIQNDEVVNMEMWTPVVNFKNISLHCTLRRVFSDQYKVEGVLFRDMEPYKVNGSIYMKDDYLVQTIIRIEPISNGSEDIIEININKKSSDSISFEIQLNSIESKMSCAISGDYFYSRFIGFNMSMLVLSSEPAIKRICITSNWQFLQNNRTIANLHLETPWRNIELENVKLWADLQKKDVQGQIQAGYLITCHKGNGKIEWSLKPEEDIHLLIQGHIIQPNTNSSYLLAEVKYFNPNKDFKELVLGGRVNLDTMWNFGLNGTLNYTSADDIEVGLIIDWPTSNGDIHELKCIYHGNLINYQGRNLQVLVEGKYNGQKSKRRCLTHFLYTNVTDIRSIFNIEWETAYNIITYKAELQILKKIKARREFMVEIITPEFGSDATLLLIGFYDKIKDGYQYINWSVDYPYTNRVADMELAFKSLSELNGYLNCTTPFLKSTWYKTAFNLTKYGGYSYRFCRLDWASDFSFIRLHKNYTSDKLDHTLEGTIEVQVPVNTRHYADIIYNLKENSEMGKGEFKVFYNKKAVVNGTYQSKEYNSSSLSRVTDITIENVIKPIGLHFVNSSYFRDKCEYSSMKRIEIFDLDNPNKFNLTVETTVIASKTKKDIKLLVIFSNRTIIFTTKDKKSDKNTIHHRGKLELSEAAWVGYNIVVGKNNMKNNEFHNFEAELSYPKRKFSVDGFYFTTLNEFNLNMSFGLSGAVDRDKNSLQTCLLWRTESLGQTDVDNQTFIFTLGHHLLEKDITLKGSYYRGIRELIKVNVLLEYSKNLDHLVAISTSLTDEREEFDLAKYAIHFLAYHRVSELDVQFNGSVRVQSSYFKMETKSLYKNDYFPGKDGVLLVLFDFNDKEIEYTRKSPSKTVRVWLKPKMFYPVYGLNVTLWITPDTNNSGYIYIDGFEKQAHLYFNLTEDNTHNLIMDCSIPNARNIYIDIWRNYDELSIVDVASYIKLNHSRHLSGRLHWRPNIKRELKEKVNTIKEALLYSFTENIEFWTKTFYVETLSSLSLIWETAKEYNSHFINDMKRVRVLEEDLEDFRVFVNKSYESDAFYIKTILNCTLTFIDEIAFRDDFGPLPIIFSEIQQVLRETGNALRKSVVEFIEMIKATYNNIKNVFINLFQGGSIRYLTDFLEKYEKFAKDLHISCINQTEYLFNNLSNLISTYLKGLLKLIEPHIFKAMSFLEGTAWDLSKELFSLIYERTNELAESTYFNQISSFTQDIENFYRYIKSNDVVTSFKHYINAIWRFLKEKYHKLIPFGSELNEVIQEIWHEIKELEKIRQMQVLVNKLKEFILNVEWIAEEVGAKEYLHKLYDLLRNKLHTHALNALEVADVYRVAKTKFIFDPEKGVIDFEQKLPMSWHAFNETPIFHEITEFQMVMRIKNVLTTSNISFLKHVYGIRSYLDLKTWLPPHYSRALLLNSEFYITFDKRFVSLDIESRKTENCTYILSHDFWNNSFTLSLDLSIAPSGTNFIRATNFILISKEHMFEIDPSTNTFTLNGDSNPLLPIKLNKVLVQRQADILSINSEDGYKIECNMGFGLCWFEVSGRYFGKTAGLLGTMNNEPFDDFMTPSNTIAMSNDNFVETWSTSICTKGEEEKPTTVISEKLTETCRILFSTLTQCMSFVDPSPFLNLCVKSGYKSERKHLSHVLSLKRSCTAALAYIEICKSSKIPMRVPHQCVFCVLTNGSFIRESTFVEYNIYNIPRSSDIVFLLEAKACSAHANGSKSFGIILTSIEEQLQEIKFINNRYAVVAFGAQLNPFIISKGNGVFVSSSLELQKYYRHVMNFIKNDNVPNVDSDVLQAISTASTLDFRPGVSKIFILLSCSGCDVTQVRFDYSSILQYMNEEGVKLHVLTYTGLDTDKPRKSRFLFGFDRHFAYSTRFPEGDRNMRNEIKISKNNLGICLPLALETGGSIFSMNKVLSERTNSIKRFATIFAKRVIFSAIPRANQTCECTGHNTGVAYMACTSRKMPDQEHSFESNDSDFSDLGWQPEDYDLE
ncbi:uncharacterized protein Apoltp [Eurosta solidaginis]|uniref:uncharacterized protein Apoltp n=1 Tax=Eurosta solidaginis TaxID=178769 RepID=UPI00353143C6